MDQWHNNVDKIPETEYCIDCIHHHIYPLHGYTHEVCNIYGKDKCHDNCDRKEITRNYQWSDKNRWE